MADLSAIPAVSAPFGLAQVVGHVRQVEELRRQLAEGATGHAYWITGPARVGKTTLALGLAAELLQADRWPGGLMVHPDLWFDQGPGSLRIERIRRGEGDSPEGPSLQHFLSLSAYAEGAKLAVIADAERLTLPASSSLLRLLEEPPPASVICLTTSRPESEHLPNTLRSRCQEIRLGPVDGTLIVAWLVSAHGFDRAAAELASALSRGRPGLALEMAADEGLEGRTEEALLPFLACAGSGPGRSLRLSRDLAERGQDREQTVFALRVWASFLQDCCSLAVGTETPTRPAAWRLAANSWAAELGPAACLRRYDLVLDALARLEENATARLVLDRLLLLCFRAIVSASPHAGGAR